MATLSNPPAKKVLPPRTRPVREVWVRNTFLSRVWATLVETLLHPFTPSVLLFERPESPHEIEVAHRDRPTQEAH